MSVIARFTALLLSFTALCAPLARAQTGTPVVSVTIPDVTITGTPIYTMDLRDYFAISGLATSSTYAQFDTVLGKINAQLLTGDAPVTVQNFLSYLNRIPGGYNNSIIHRSVPGFIIQGGGYIGTLPLTAITANAPVINEYKISNTRGTIAMAKLGGDPNSATKEWFFNLADNSANLDNQNGGFTVFGRVIGTGMSVVDAIAAVPRFNAGGAFTDIPLRDYTSGNSAQLSNLIIINSVATVPLFPASANAAAVARFEVSGAVPSIASVTISGSVLTILPAAGANGVANITVRAVDSNDNGVNDTFRLVVVPGFAIAQQPADVTTTAGQNASLSVVAAGADGITYQWNFNGQDIAGATQATYAIANAQPANVGLYAVRISAPGREPLYSRTAVLSLLTTSKVTGAGSEVGSNIAHPNGNVYDQVLLQGAAATITADGGQVTRISFIDLSDDIVQVEFSGAGALTVSLENASGPALPVKYNQTVSYMKGHATITVAGAGANTHVSIFTVGTFTAVNQAIFKTGVTYDGVADVALLSIASTDGRFGGVRTANTEFSSSHGLVGVNAPNIGFAGPINLHNISTSNTAEPVLLTAGVDTNQIGITGGDMFQATNRAVAIGGVTTIRMLAGATSHNVAQPAQTNRGRYERNSQDVTAQVVQGP